MLASKVMPVTDIGSAGLFDAAKREQRLTALREEVYSRLRANLTDKHAGQVPLQFLKLNPEIKTALLVDKSQNRIYVYQRSAPDQPPHLLRDFYVSTGKRNGNKEAAGDNPHERAGRRCRRERERQRRLGLHVQQQPLLRDCLVGVGEQHVHERSRKLQRA